MNDSTDIFDTPAELPPEDVVEAKESRNLALLGGLAAVLVLGAGAYFLLGGSDDATEGDFGPVAAPVPSAAAPDIEGPTAALPPPSQVQLGRNPFEALYVAPAGSSGGGPDVSGTTPENAGGPTSNAPAGGDPTLSLGGSLGSQPTGSGPGSTPVSPSDPTVNFPIGSGPGSTPIGSGPGSTPIVVIGGNGGGGNGGGGTQQPAPAPAPTRPTVALGKVSVDSKKVPTGVFTYNGTQYKGKPGDILDGKLLVISIQQDQTGAWFANLQLGDGSPFEVHQRQTVVVQ